MSQCCVCVRSQLHRLTNNNNLCITVSGYLAAPVTSGMNESAPAVMKVWIGGDKKNEVAVKAWGSAKRWMINLNNGPVVFAGTVGKGNSWQPIELTTILRHA